MRALAVLFLALVLLAGCGDGSSQTAARVKAVVASQKYDKKVRDISCKQGERFRMPEGVSGWRCALVFSDGSKGSCDAFSERDRATLSVCRGVVVAPPSLAEVERQMQRSADGVERATCRPDGPRKWTCRLIFRDRPDGTGTYESSPSGMAIVGSSSTLVSPGAP